jgi:hypothetical protein
MGGKGNALKACDVGDIGDVVGDDAADDDGESIVVIVFGLLFPEVAEWTRVCRQGSGIRCQESCSLTWRHLGLTSLQWFTA